MASELARAGVQDYFLIDPDVVEWPNLTRTVYGHKDIGRPKVDALADHLKGIFADITVATHAGTVQQLAPDFATTFRDVSLVVCAVDEPPATGLINRYCYALGIAAVFVGLYKGAKGGEVIVTLPEKTPCFHCSTGGMRRVVEDTGIEGVSRTQRDYGTNRLVAEVALGSDIHFVCCAAVKLCLSILSRSGEGATSELALFFQQQQAERCNFVMLGMTPNYFMFPTTHATAIGQYAFQSLWAQTSSDDQCDVCGLPENREPLARVTAG
jgi:molybdopterin/thiamine biosynthesis adenylyltransferase